MSQEKRRQGKITILRRWAVEHPSQLRKMFNGIRFTPLMMDVDIMFDKIVYCGFSPLFEKIDRQTLLPSYRVIAAKVEGKPMTFTVEKETLC